MGKPGQESLRFPIGTNGLWSPGTAGDRIHFIISHAAAGMARGRIPTLCHDLRRADFLPCRAVSAFRRSALPCRVFRAWAVSYTHLDVYKRQPLEHSIRSRKSRSPVCSSTSSPKIVMGRGWRSTVLPCRASS